MIFKILKQLSIPSIIQNDQCQIQKMVRYTNNTALVQMSSTIYSITKFFKHMMHINYKCKKVIICNNWK